MAATRVTIRNEPIWIVDAKCSDESSSWKFENKEDAQRFAKIAEEWWSARCPECGAKDSTNLDFHEFGEAGGTVLVWCAWYECSFSKKMSA